MGGVKRESPLVTLFFVINKDARRRRKTPPNNSVFLLNNPREFVQSGYHLPSSQNKPVQIIQHDLVCMERNACLSAPCEVMMSMVSW